MNNMTGHHKQTLHTLEFGPSIASFSAFKKNATFEFRQNRNLFLNALG